VSVVLLLPPRRRLPPRGGKLIRQKSAEVVVPAGERTSAGKDRTSGEAEESGLLVLAAVIAAIPRTRASCREETVNPVEYRSGA
jgi:hypothetical protein